MGLAALAVWQRAQSTSGVGHTRLHRWRDRRHDVASGTVAGLAVHVRVLALALGVGDVGVAVFAGLVAGKLHRRAPQFRRWPRRDSARTARSSWALRNAAHHQKDKKGEDKEPRKSEKMPCILKKFHQAVSEERESFQRVKV